VEEIDRQQEEEERLDKAKEEIKKREKDESVRKGRKGKGHIKGYVRFCRFCFTEYLIDIAKCTHCNRDTITEEVF
jgi:hypothetical protein